MLLASQRLPMRGDGDTEASSSQMLMALKCSGLLLVAAQGDLG